MDRADLQEIIDTLTDAERTIKEFTNLHGLTLGVAVTLCAIRGQVQKLEEQRNVS